MVEQARKSLLEHYIREHSPERVTPTHIDDFVLHCYNLESKTRKIYATDIALFLLDKFVYFWDFHKDYRNIAANLATLEALDKADLEIRANNLTSAEGNNLLKYFESSEQPQKLLPGIVLEEKIVHPQIDLAFKLLGPNFSYDYVDDRFVMQLKSPEKIDKIIPVIRKENRMKLDFLMSVYKDQMDERFWGDYIFMHPKPEQVLNLQQNQNRDRNTIARRACSIRKFEDYLHSVRLVKYPIMKYVSRPSVRKKPQIFLKPEELKSFIEKLDKECEKTKERDHLRAVRDRAMLGLIYETAVRNESICRLKRDEVDLKNHSIYFHLKGGKEEIYPLKGTILKYVEEHIELLPKMMEEWNVEERNTDYLFFSCHGNPMENKSLRRITSYRAKQAGIEKKVGKHCEIGPHVIRRSVSAMLREKGATIRELMILLGHERESTTRIYLQNPSNDVKNHQLK